MNSLNPPHRLVLRYMQHPRMSAFLELLVPWLRKRWLWLALPSAALLVASHYVSIGANLTVSLPQRMFLVLKYDKSVATGNFAVFTPPASEFHDQQARLVKLVGGVPGDVLHFEGQQFFINGQPMGIAKTHSSRGPKAGLRLSKSAEGVIPPGYFFMYAPHEDSLDSRYSAVGLVPQDRIVGRALALF